MTIWYGEKRAKEIDSNRKLKKGNKAQEPNSKKQHQPNFGKYSLFLWPGKLNLKLYIYLVFVFPVALSPLLNTSIKEESIGFEILLSNNIIDPNLWLISIFTGIIFFFYFHEIYQFIINLPRKIKSLSHYLCILIRNHTLKLLLQISFIFFCLFVFGVLIESIINLETVRTFITGQARLFILILLATSLFAILIFRLIFHRMKPVLFRTWSKWPETQYDLFLTVPHKVELTPIDKTKERYKYYWNPDSPTPASQQALHYAKARNSLQEVILNLALFDFLFRKKSDLNTEGSKKGLYSSVRLENWFVYFLSPVWISYALLLFIMFLTQLIFKYSINACSTLPMLFNYPNNFAWSIVIWFFISYFFVQSRIKQLEILYSKIHQGYFHTHLELVPQQILDDIAQIPSRVQLQEAIESMQKLLNIMLIAALPVFLLLLEIFSNSLKQ